MAFHPRGLLRTPSREELWKETRDTALDLRESKTSELWEDILHEVFIQQDTGYYVNSQQPPEDGSSKYCDFIVSAKTGGSKKIRLIVVEAKRLKAYQSRSRVEALEQQLLDYCADSLNDLSVADSPRVYGLAVVGTRGRLFSVWPGEGLRPVLPGFASDAGTDVNGYRDAEEDIWNEAFRLVKAMPPSGALANPL